MELTEALHWRYATKRMNGQKLSEAQMNQILEAIRLSPSSRGLQPYKIFVVDDATTKQKIQQVADHQPQIVESSHLLVFAAWSGITAQQINDFVQFAADERKVPVTALEKIKNMLMKDQLGMDGEEFYNWASKQIYLALGIALVAAAVQRIDATPMEGFNSKEMDALLGLESQGYRSTVLLALGHRDETQDWLLKLKKVRRTREELFKTISSKLL